MANTLIDSIKYRNNLRKARRTVNSLINGTIKVDDVPNDIKEIILREKMIEEKSIILELLANINDDNLFQKIINENVKTFEELNELSDNLKYRFLINTTNNIQLSADLINIIASIQNQEYRMQLYDKYIDIKSLNIDALFSLSEDKVIEVIGNKLNQFAYNDITKIIENVSEENLLTLFTNNKEFIQRILSFDFNPFYENGFGKQALLLDNDGKIMDRKYILSKKLKSIENNEILEGLHDFVDREALIAEVDKVLANRLSEVPSAFDYLILEDDKLKYLESIPVTDIERCQDFYLRLKEETREKYRYFLLNSNNLDNMINEILTNYHNYKSYEYLFRDLVTRNDLNEETLIKLFPTGKSNELRLDDIKKIIFDKLSDNGKLIILSNKDNFLNKTVNRYNQTLSAEEMLKLVDTIEDKYLYAQTMMYALENAKNFYVEGNGEENSYYYKQIINEYFSQVSDDRKFEIIKKLFEPNVNKDMIVLNSLLLHLNDSKIINEVLKLDLYDYEKYKGYSRYKKNHDLGQEEEYNKEQLMITRLISKLENTDDLLKSVDLSKFYDSNIIQILIKSSSEIPFETLPSHPSITPEVIRLCKEYSSKLNQLTRKDYPEEDLLRFYEKITNAIINNGQDLNKKLIYLTMLQEKNEEVGITANLGMLDDEILKIFGGIDGVERLLKYPKLQKNIVNRSEKEKKIISICNKYINENLQMGDYSLAEIVNQYSLNFGNINIDNVTEEDYEVIYEMAMAREILELQCFDQLLDNINNPKQYTAMKNEICDGVISGKIEYNSFLEKNAYLFKYYNMSYDEATAIVTRFEEYIKTMPNDEECRVYKEYILGLKEVLNASSEEIIEAYNLSKDKESIHRIEIEIMNEQLKTRFAKQMKSTLFDTKKQSITSTIDYQGHKIQVYEADKDFQMLVSVLDAYGGDKVDYEDYNKQWNTSEHSANQRICASYISDRNLGIVKKHNCVIMGFEGFSDYAVVEAAPYDMVSVNNELVTRTKRADRFMDPKTLLDSTRRYSEINIERTDIEHGGKLQPSYLISFASSINEVEEETKKAATQFEIPIVLINHEKIEFRNSSNLQEKIDGFIESRNPALVSEIIQDYWIYKNGSKTTAKDENDEKVQAEDLEAKYFSNDRFKTIMKTIQEIAKEEESIGNIDLSKEIFDALSKAINDEKAIDAIWIDQFFPPQYFPTAKQDNDKFWNLFPEEMQELAVNLKEINSIIRGEEHGIQR